MLVIVSRDKAVVTSFEIAKAFKLSHEEVIKDIENIERSESLRCSDFDKVRYYPDKEEHYNITHNGLCTLALLCSRYQNKKILEETLMQFYVIEQLLREKLIDNTRYEAIKAALSNFNTR